MTARMILSLTALLSFVAVAEQAEPRVQGVREECLDVQLKESVECYKDAIHAFLESWVTSWGKGDFESYLEHYVPESSPRSGLSAVQWESRQRKRIAGRVGIAVTLELESMKLNKFGVTEVIFTQFYQSPNYSDKVVKKLSLVRITGHFAILREQSLSRLE